MKKCLFLFPIFLYCLLFSRVNHVLGASNFLTDYNVRYDVLETGTTNVTFNIVLTNQASQFYASSYSINVGFKNIENVVARDSTEIIKSKVIKNDDGNSIELVFGKKVVGINQKFDFTVSFSTPDIARQSGKIWDVNIPGLSRQNEFRNFNARITVPKTLGNPTYIKPYTQRLNGNIFDFTKEELGKSGISISFGKEEIYGFDLLYHLKNPNLFPIKTQIALPPSTNYQDVMIEKIDPKPLNVIIDQDGNWLAQYVLSPSKQLNVKVSGKARISFYPKKQKETKEKLTTHLKQQPFWETSDKHILELAAKLKTPYNIYSYVVRTLKYDFSRVSKNLPRLGAKKVLENPNSAVCLEFTDLFIALARAAGIPAREINGFAYTQNSKEKPLSLVKDVLHSWPEYYDYNSESWVMIDPTWGNTTGGVDYFYTLDSDHFAFVIKGVTSSYPIPAGGYKNSNENSKDVNVTFADNFNSKDGLLINEDFDENYLSFLDISGNILIRNTGNIASNPQIVKIESNFLTPSKEKISFGSVPPFGHLAIPITFDRQPFLTNKFGTITIQVNENSIAKNIKISPFTINKWSFIGGTLFASIIIASTSIINKTWHLLFFRKKK